MGKFCFMGVMLPFVFLSTALGAEPPISDDTVSCVECHGSLHPGIVAEWKKSRMARMTPSAAKRLPERERRVSYGALPDSLANVVVGCAECHTMNPQKHKDTFEHNGFEVHTVVTPDDCAACHPVERAQFSSNLMSHAYGNLEDNPVYKDLVKSAIGVQSFSDMSTALSDPDHLTSSDACLQCHGTVVGVRGKASRETDLGDMIFPVLSGWPNQGVGRVNPDGSEGACSACHTRHQFSVEVARKPYTCSQCHKGPDVPAFKVYEVSKHGNVYSSLGASWNYESVPWVIGKDITAPTCATCHVSLIVSGEGDVLAERTHRMNDRLPWRIFGPIYAHPHSKSADTTIIRNKAGLPFPADFTGEPATKYLIDTKEQEMRRKTMQRVCLSCHSRTWVDGHFARFENTIKKTNEMTLTATKILLAAWEKGAAKGLDEKDSIFNEAIEKKWVEQWLFYANSTRFSSAMMGADYGAFANGRWYMAKNVQEMMDWLEFKLKEK
jgi:hydroxylamine dehydrogenase